jgi:hypothetical protein
MPRNNRDTGQLSRRLLRQCGSHLAKLSGITDG